MDTQERISEEAVTESSTTVVPTGAILAVVRSGILARSLPIALTGTRVAFNQDIKALVPNAAVVDVWFLFWALRFVEPYILLHGIKKGATVHSTRSGFLEHLEIALPPLAEQKRIAAIVNEQMAVVERARAAAEARLEAARALPAAYLRAVFNSPEAQSWPRRRLGSICHIQLGKMLSPKSKTGLRPRPYLRNANVQWNCFDLSEVVEMDFSEIEEGKFALRQGDLLVCEGGEAGRSAVWQGQIESCCYQKALHRLRPINEHADPYFLMYRLWLGALNAEFYDSQARTTIAHLPAVRLEQLLVGVPSLAEQQRIAGTLFEQMAVVERVRKAIEEQLDTINRLPAALLRQPFVGNFSLGENHGKDST